MSSTAHEMNIHNYALVYQLKLGGPRSNKIAVSRCIFAVPKEHLNASTITNIELLQTALSRPIS